MSCEKLYSLVCNVKLIVDTSAVQSMPPDAAIFNSMIAACAHGGEFAKARVMFDSMGEHNCQPDAVTFANLIRAYKKGGQWYVIHLSVQ